MDKQTMISTLKADTGFIEACKAPSTCLGFVKVYIRLNDTRGHFKGYGRMSGTGSHYTHLDYYFSLLPEEGYDWVYTYGPGMSGTILSITGTERRV